MLCLCVQRMLTLVQLSSPKQPSSYSQDASQAELRVEYRGSGTGHTEEHGGSFTAIRGFIEADGQTHRNTLNPQPEAGKAALKKGPN